MKWGIDTLDGEWSIVKDTPHGTRTVCVVPDRKDAELIASAPELLKALKWANNELLYRNGCLCAVETGKEDKHTKSCGLGKLQDAISKVESRE